MISSVTLFLTALVRPLPFGSRKPGGQCRSRCGLGPGRCCTSGRGLSGLALERGHLSCGSQRAGGQY
eukprot:8373912-Prorocentrum_lima.AAC.1